VSLEGAQRHAIPRYRLQNRLGCGIHPLNRTFADIHALHFHRFCIKLLGRTLAWDRQIIILCAVIAALIFGIVWLLNAWGAERLQRKLDELDGLR
jgi:hypothetical protein